MRVLFYGQSITQQAWWREVERYLRATYTNANLIIENRDIGGHASQLLVKTAEADLYPFQPDLLIKSAGRLRTARSAISPFAAASPEKMAKAPAPTGSFPIPAAS